MRQRRAGALAMLALAAAAFVDAAGDLPDGTDVMRRVNERSRGDASRMRLELMLHDAKRGDFKKSVALERRRFGTGYRTSYRILSPRHEEGIGLLLAEDSEMRGMWMYFPISDHLVRVASRGLSALASDFTCEDLLVELPIDEYAFRTLDRRSLDGVPTLRVEMRPRTERLRRELGFDRAVGWVREDIWMIVRADYYTEAGQRFKTFEAGGVERIEGIWTVRRYSMTNHRADHGTEVRVAEVAYDVEIPAERLVPESLAQTTAADPAGAPAPAP